MGVKHTRGKLAFVKEIRVMSVSKFLYLIVYNGQLTQIQFATKWVPLLNWLLYVVSYKDMDTEN